MLTVLYNNIKDMTPFNPERSVSCFARTTSQYYLRTSEIDLFATLCTSHHLHLARGVSRLIRHGRRPGLGIQ